MQPIRGGGDHAEGPGHDDGGRGPVVGVAGGAGGHADEFIDTANNEWSVAVEAGYTVWAVDKGTSYVWSLKVKPAGQPAYAVNPTTTSAEAGSIELGGPHGDVLVYGVGAKRGIGDWSVRLWDLAAKKFLPVPAGINTTAKSERNPSISGDHLLFGRGVKGAPFSQKVVLYRPSAPVPGRDDTGMGAADDHPEGLERDAFGRADRPELAGAAGPGIQRDQLDVSVPVLRLYRRLGIELEVLASPRRVWGEDRVPVRFGSLEEAGPEVD